MKFSETPNSSVFPTMGHDKIDSDGCSGVRTSEIHFYGPQTSTPCPRMMGGDQ